MRRFIWACGVVLSLSVVLGLLWSHAEAPKKLIIVDTLRMSLTLYENGQEVRRFPIAAGTGETPTPLGSFRVVRRFIPETANGFGTRFMGLNVPWGIYGIHGTNRPGSIGSHASHGCIRMYSKDAETLYALIPDGTRVIIENGPYGELGNYLKELKPGDRDSAVRAVQRKLLVLGYYHGSLDGIFGAGTINALKTFLKERDLAWEEKIDRGVYDALGLMLFE